jgi:hypothetical protein
MLVPALVLAISAPAAAQEGVPIPFRNLKPVQIVEVVATERQALDLTGVQVGRLDSLSLLIKNEPHRYVTAGAPGKAHRNTRMEPMISREQAYADALAILTPSQRARATAVFSDPGYQLPSDFQKLAAEVSESASQPLQDHGAGAAPVEQSTKSPDSAQEPLQHHGGQAPTSAAADTGKAANPVTHREE